MNHSNDISRRKFLRAGVLGLAGFSAFPASAWKDTDILLRTIPSSGEKIPAIGMGSWLTFDVGNSEQERAPMRNVLRTFHESGGRVLDSSPMYGRSERVIGDLAAELGITDQLWFSTKVWTTGEASGKQQAENSMRLFRKNPSVLHIHNLLDYATHIKNLRRLKESGTIRYVGVTHYLESAHEEVARLIRRESLDFLQINLSVRTRNAEASLLSLAAERGMAVIINRPFEQGALFGMVKNAKLPPWAAEWDMTNWASFFLKYILSNPHVTCVIPATTSVAHVKENMAAGTGALPDEATRKRMVEYFGNL